LIVSTEKAASYDSVHHDEASFQNDNRLLYKICIAIDYLVHGIILSGGVIVKSNHQ
jgi:hypothetical protein